MVAIFSHKNALNKIEEIKNKYPNIKKKKILKSFDKIPKFSPIIFEPMPIMPGKALKLNVFALSFINFQSASL